MYPGMANPDPPGSVNISKQSVLRQIRDYISQFRDNMQSFDLMHYGDISSDYEKEKLNLLEWEEAGLTWWAQTNDYTSYEKHRERILAGPPKKPMKV